MRAALVVLDGWGIGSGVTDPDGEHRDAAAAAATPVVDDLLATRPSARLRTDGRFVGLPPGQFGNSEVGHLTIGAGRVVEQDATRISASLAAWARTAEADLAALATELPGAEAATDVTPIDQTPVADAVAHAAVADRRLHLMGLISDGGVHAMQAHAHAVAAFAATHGVAPVVHAFTDGRDTPPTSGERFLAALERALARTGGAVATVSGRYYAMDRDENWSRTRAAYDAIVAREASHEATTPVDAVRAGYDRGETDEHLTPTVVTGGAPVRDGDAVIVCNFRADRARQLVRMLAGIDPEPSFPTPPAVELVTMTEYEATFGLPVAFPPRQPTAVLGTIVAAAEHTQARLAESEKYAHVTYFLNGGRESTFDGEVRRIVPSPDVSTYDQRPAMAAADLTDEALTVIDDVDPALLVLNYANPDMVGHTGDFSAAVAACEAVDEQLGRLLPALRAAGAGVLVTADHGNADDMGSPADPHTAHTANPVPVVYVPPADGSPPARGPDTGRRELRDGGLADVAPTLLDLMGLSIPSAMTGRSLFEAGVTGNES